jgi:tripartite-type tricarboxylate transporter receptor subunit TctC
MIIPLAAGGSVDLIARPLAEDMSKLLSRPIVVENMPGASTNIGAGFVARSAPDGSTLLVTAAAITIQPGINPKMPYDPQQDLAGISVISNGTILLVVSPRLGVKSLREFISHAKANPGKLSYGSAGAGGSLHLAGELLKMEAGIDMVHVPYKGGAPILVDLMGGNIEVTFVSAAVALPLISSGKIVPIAVASTKRSPSMPSLPAIAESYPGFEVTARNGIMVRRGTPKPVVTELNTVVVKSVSSPELKAKFAKAGVEAISSTPEEFDAEIRNDIRQWTRVARSIGLVLEN